jgi:hypothetical protein
MPKCKLLVGTPCYGGVVTQRYMQCMCSLLLQTASLDISVQLELLGYESLVTRGRNTLVAKFLDSDATHLMFIDADIGFETQQILRMISFDKDVVAGMYPLKVIGWDQAAVERINAGEPPDHAPLRFVGTPCDGGERETEDGFVTGTYAGAGFLLMKRRVIEAMIAAYPETHYTAAHTAAVPSLSPNQYALFDCMIDPGTREYLSEDYAFCTRWRATGGKVWLDTRSLLAHIGPHEFVGSPKPRFEASTNG